MSQNTPIRITPLYFFPEQEWRDHKKGRHKDRVYIRKPDIQPLIGTKWLSMYRHNAYTTKYFYDVKIWKISLVQPITVHLTTNTINLTHIPRKNAPKFGIIFQIHKYQFAISQRPQDISGSGCLDQYSCPKEKRRTCGIWDYRKERKSKFRFP